MYNFITHQLKTLINDNKRYALSLFDEKFLLFTGLTKKKKKESHHRVKLSKLGKKKSEANPFLSPF